MAACKECDGFGSIECPECMEKESLFLFDIPCHRCRGGYLVICSTCGGSGEEIRDKK